MRRNPPTPLTSSEQEALTLLEDRVATGDDALPRETAVDHLVDGGFVWDVAVHLIEQLLLKGYLYKAEEGLRLTDGP